MSEKPLTMHPFESVMVSACEAEITRLEARVKQLEAALNADNQTLRLHLGEMTAQEMRTLRAGFAWALSRAALNPSQDKAA